MNDNGNNSNSNNYEINNLVSIFSSDLVLGYLDFRPEDIGVVALLTPSAP